MTNINNTIYNNQYVFDQWILKANSCLQNFNFSDSIDRSDINIKVSNDILHKKYGCYTYEEIKKIILDKYEIDVENFDKAIHLIKEEGFCVVDDVVGGLVREINEKNNEEFDEKKRSDIRKELVDLFGNVGRNDVILGTFYNPTKTITLYVKSIEKHAQSLGISYIQALEVTFIHELFHAFHYKNNDDELVCRWDYTSEVVKESLASFFEYTYCMKNNYILSAQNLEDNWLHYSVYCYPYSGGLRFRNSYFNFKDIFDISLIDMDQALRKLLDKSMYYKIKNKVERIYVSQNHCIMPSKGMNKVYVCKNKLSYDNEKNGGYLNAPDKSRYNILKTVQPGDVIFHIFKNQLHALSIAQSNYYVSNNFIYVNSQYYELNNPCDISALKKDPNYLNKKGDTHYLSLCKNNTITILNSIINLALTNDPNDSFLLKIKYFIN